MPCIPSSGCLAGLWGCTPGVRQTAIMADKGGRNGFDGDVDARGLRAEALHLVKSGKPIVANDYPLAQAA
jgi:hypothetical protein